MSQAIVVNVEARQYDLKAMDGKRVVNVILNPGVNTVVKEDWEYILKADPYVKALFDDGIFEAEAKLDKALKSLAEFKPGDAIKLVKDCGDLALLDAWGKTEIRPKVKEAIDAQLEILTKPVDDKKE